MRGSDDYNEVRPEFRKRDAEIRRISVDSAWCHAAYAGHNHIHFPLPADFHPKGLPESELASALEEGTYEPIAREDFLGGVRSGVNGTPTFFINGERHDGSWEYEALVRAINATMQNGPRSELRGGR